MSRPLVWLTALLAGFALLAATAFWKGLDRVPVTVHTGFLPPAQRDPYLALERFTAAMGRPLTRSTELSVLDQLPVRGVLILDQGHTRVLTRARIERILKWVEGGGHLLLAMPVGDQDPLLRAVKVRVVPPRPGEKVESDSVVSLRPVGSLVVINASIAPSAPVLESYGPTPNWIAGNRLGARIMQFGRGEGAITIVPSWSDLASNTMLGKEDNSQAAWLLLNLVNHTGPILFLSEPRLPTLWDWLRESAWMVLVSTALLIIFWLLKIVPRFGPMTSDAPRNRRALVEHLEAMGRAVWRTKEDEGLRYWIYCVRRSVLARAALREPGLVQKSPIEQARAIAARVAAGKGLEAARVRSAFAGVATGIDGALARKGFTQAIAVLQRVEDQL